MAYVPKQLPEDEQNQFGRTEETTPFPDAPAGGGSAGSGTAKGGAAPGVGTSTQFGSNAAKLSDYLKANEPQVAEFGNKVAGNLTQGYQSTLGAVDQGYNDFNKGLNQGLTPGNEEMLGKATTNASDFIKDPNNVSAFRKEYDTYSGPKNFETFDKYSDINKQVNDAVTKGSLVGSQGGLGSYLSNYMGTQNNTPGMQSLDTALLQRSPEASTAIRNAAAPYSGLSSYLSGKAQSANQNAFDALGKQKDFQNKFGQGKTGYETGIDTRANALLDASPVKQDWNDFMQNINTAGAGAYQTSLSPQQLLRYGTAKPEEQMNIDALNSLAGSENTFLPSNYSDQIPKGGGALTAMLDKINGKTPAPWTPTTPTEPGAPPIAIEPSVGTPTPPEPGTPPNTGSPGTPTTPTYSETNPSTWTMEHHPDNAFWDPDYGWTVRRNYKNPGQG